MLRSHLTAFWFLFAVGVSSFACSGSVQESSASGGSGGGAGVGGGGGACALPDVVCPAKVPFPGARCELADTCQYPVGDGMNTWTFTCGQGRWAGDATCEGAIGGGCPVPPLSETCNKPFAGQAAGAVVEIGAADPAKPFEPLPEGSELSLIWGGQGSPMVGYRVRVSGVDASCVRADTTLSAAGKPSASTPAAITLHCNGESLGVYGIFPLESVCDLPENQLVDFEVEIDVQGAGRVKRTFKVMNPGCMLTG